MSEHAGGNFRPNFSVLADIGVLLETSEVEIAPLFLGIMAADAIRFEERTDFLLKSAVRALRRGGAMQHDGADQQGIKVSGTRRKHLSGLGRRVRTIELSVKTL